MQAVMSFVSFIHTPTTNIYTLSLHDALPISRSPPRARSNYCASLGISETVICRSRSSSTRSEEHTSELQSRFVLVCRLLLEKKNNRGAIAGNYQDHLRFVHDLARRSYFK